MNLLGITISDQIVHALGWTLIHSLWQGAVIGLLMAGVMTYLRHRNARLRYMAYIAGLLLLFTASVITYSIIFHHNGPVKQITSEQKTISDPLVSGVILLIRQGTSETLSSSITGIKHTIEATINFFETNTPVFVIIWIAGMLIFLIKLLGGLAYAHRLKSAKTRCTGEEILKRFMELKKKIGLSSKIDLLESVMVKVPMVVGCLKPVILLPAGVISGLPMQQIETILIHELIHIYRKDYLVNIFQSVMEVLFFFNPVIWWISRNIRIERENICDDMTLAYCQDSLTYARALASLQEIEQDIPVMATALTGRREQLLNRIYRIIGRPYFKPAFTEGIIPAIVILVIALTLSSHAALSFGASEKDIRTEAYPGQSSVTWQSPPLFVGLVPETGSKSKNSLNSEKSLSIQPVGRIQMCMPGPLLMNPSVLLMYNGDTTKITAEKSMQEAKKVYEEAIHQQNEAMKEMQKTIEMQRRAQEQYIRALREQQRLNVEKYRQAREERYRNFREQYKHNCDSLDYNNQLNLVVPNGLWTEFFDLPVPGNMVPPCLSDKYFKFKRGKNFFYFGDTTCIDTIGNLGSDKFKRFFYSYGFDSLSTDTAGHPCNLLWSNVLDLPPGVIEELDSVNDVIGDYSFTFPEDSDKEEFQYEWQKALKDYDFQYALPEEGDLNIEFPEGYARPLPPTDDLFYGYNYDYDYAHHSHVDVLKVKQIIREELISDGLIEEERSYIVEINAKEMVINGEKQDKDVHSKYKRLLESALGEKLKDGYTYFF
jgi:beta-lactamase regulating signal transducer with metallopeptidase domain